MLVTTTRMGAGQLEQELRQAQAAMDTPLFRFEVRCLGLEFGFKGAPITFSLRYWLRTCRLRLAYHYMMSLFMSGPVGWFMTY